MPEPERPVNLTAVEGERLMDPFDEVRVLDIDDETYRALRKLQDHQAAFGGTEELGSIEVEIEGGGKEVFTGPSFQHLIVEIELPITGGERLLKVAHSELPNAVSSLTSAIRHKEDPERVMKRALVVGALAGHIYDTARNTEPEEWSG